MDTPRIPALGMPLSPGMPGEFTLGNADNISNIRWHGRDLNIRERAFSGHLLPGR